MNPLSAPDAEPDVIWNNPAANRPATSAPATRGGARGDRRNKPPNNRLTDDVAKSNVIWNDKEILSRLAEAANVGTPQLGTMTHARAVADLFTKAGHPPPTEGAALQWVRRGIIPDRWRPGVVYLLMRDNTLRITHLFRRTPKSPEAQGA